MEENETVEELTKRIENRIMEAGKSLVGKPLDKAALVDLTKQSLLESQTKTGIKVICDETNNTEEDRQNGVLNATIIPPKPLISISLHIDKDGTITRMEDNEVGIWEGDNCNREGCQGTIQIREPENCSCHISSPCGSCTTPREYCDECGWEASEE